jgi:hypothetical protein
LEIRMTRSRFIATFVVLSLAIVAPARAIDRVWFGGSGNWTDPSHWNPSGAPVAGDGAFLMAIEPTDKLITYDDARPTPPLYNKLFIDENGPGSVTLRQSANLLTAQTLTMGSSGPVMYEMYGGTGSFSTATVESHGHLAVSGTAHFNAGSFTQRGLVTLFSAFNAQDYAQYAGSLYLGENASYTGVNFRQQGAGISTIDRTMRLTGSYLFNSGPFNVTPPTDQLIKGGVSCATFEYNSAGSFGGSLEVTQRLNLWVGTATILGDLVNRGQSLTIWDDQSLGVGQDATMIGGTIAQAGTFGTPISGNIRQRPGRLNLAGGARWTQNGGMNVGGSVVVGSDQTGAATYTLNSGSVNLPNGGSIYLGHLSDGSFIQNGGNVIATTLVVGGAPTASFAGRYGTYVKNGGSLGGQFLGIIIGRDFSAGGAFTQNAGDTSCTELWINENGTNRGELNITGGSFTVNGRTINHGSFTQSGGVATFSDNFDGAGSVRLTGNAEMGVHRLRQNSVFIGGTARVHGTGNAFAPPTHRVLSLGFEEAAGGAFRGTWDLGASDLVIDYTGASPIASVQRYLASGYAGGNWNGTGLSSTAAAIQGRALGVAEASDVLGPAGGVFSGVFADPTSLLVMYTRSGDANLDGGIDLLDFNRLAVNFGRSGKVWSQGDFNYDGLVDLFDFNLLAANFGLAASGEVSPQDWSALAAAVPEPALASLPFAAAILLLGPRKRR